MELGQRFFKRLVGLGQIWVLRGDSANLWRTGVLQPDSHNQFHETPIPEASAPPMMKVYMKIFSSFQQEGLHQKSITKQKAFSFWNDIMSTRPSVLFVWSNKNPEKSPGMYIFFAPIVHRVFSRYTVEAMTSDEAASFLQLTEKATSNAEAKQVWKKKRTTKPNSEEGGSIRAWIPVLITVKSSY